jgi:polysaccharide export outer membrane protein
MKASQWKASQYTLGTLTAALFVSVFFLMTAPASAQTPAPPPDQSAVSQPSQTPAGGGEYVIGPTDVIIVTVLREPGESGTLLVRPDGMISMQLVGDIQAAGLTPHQLELAIAERLRKFMQDPNVTVALSAVNSKKVYLMGEVTKVGPVEITPGMTLLEAISSAGGLTQFANSKKMYILRKTNGKQQKLPVNYKKALKGDSSLNIALEPGDTIVVP